MARFPFRARARTVDHLGREQIADCPTAVSELWKNAYDAYATRVELHVFDGDVPVAAVVDDGHGMSMSEFVDRWLMLGTESKLEDAETAPEDRDGLPVRRRQGQKGIGRLSVAYLGPTVIVLTKRRSGPFVAALLDWRIYQNPYLTLDDVRVPVEEFEDPDKFPEVLASLLDGLIDNIWGAAAEPERKERLEAAWRRHSTDEAARGLPTSAAAIESLALTARLEERHLATWPAWMGRTKGTALFVFDVVRELRVWVAPHIPDEDPEVRDVRDKLRFTLTGFADPYTAAQVDFAYAACVHRGSTSRIIVSNEETFGLDDLRDLEHVVEGEFDHTGLFTGHVKAWGKDLGKVTFAPSRPVPTRGTAYVGPFSVAFGTFELEPKNSTHTADVIGRLRAQADQFSGLAVYRDGLRVQPYGRPQADFFGMEERRSKHAGRGYWAHRRTFGRVAITNSANPHLRDKAGREGLIDNQAAREFRYLVEDLLSALARRYFGTEADLRATETAETQARFERAQKAETRAKKLRVSSLREALKQNESGLASAVASATALVTTLEEARADDTDLEELANTIDTLRRMRLDLALPPRPRKLAPGLEERYRAYRDSYGALTATLERVSARFAGLAEEARRDSAEEAARSALARHQKFLTDSTSRWKWLIREVLQAEQKRWSDRADADNAKYYAQAASLLDDVAQGRMPVGPALSELEAIRERLYTELARDYEGYLRALNALAHDIDLDAALAWATDERTTLLDRVDQWQTLAQLGITVEIVGHELNETAAQVSRNLSRLPAQARDTDAFKLASEGFRALVHRLEFLAPLRLSGPRTREPIDGRRIYGYLLDFFAKQLAARKVALKATDAFERTVVLEYPHRVFPVFINLVNNAIYWVTFRPEREILLDRRGLRVFVADSGPGIDEDDVPELFRLFFTRRVGGHGVGLYLSRLALEQGGHTIRLADRQEQLLPGANFVIEFRDLQE